jgi:hypothetical protein
VYAAKLSFVKVKDTVLTAAQIHITAVTVVLILAFLTIVYSL